MFITFSGHSQTLQYDIFSNETHIGDLKVVKASSKDIVQIEVTSEVHVKLFIEINLTYKLNCTYKNNKLWYSSVTTFVNGKVHSTSKTEKVGNYYTIVKNGHSSKFMDDIDFSGALLYFEEPKGIKQIFSEFDNIYKPINSIGSHEYQIVNPKNDYLSEYQYQNGILKSTTNHHKLLTFTLKLK